MLLLVKIESFKLQFVKISAQCMDLCLMVALQIKANLFCECLGILHLSHKCHTLQDLQVHTSMKGEKISCSCSDTNQNLSSKLTKKRVHLLYVSEFVLLKTHYPINPNNVFLFGYIPNTHNIAYTTFYLATY